MDSALTSNALTFRRSERHLTRAKVIFPIRTLISPNSDFTERITHTQSVYFTVGKAVGSLARAQYAMLLLPIDSVMVLQI